MLTADIFSILGMCVSDFEEFKVSSVYLLYYHIFEKFLIQNNILV